MLTPRRSLPLVLFFVAVAGCRCTEPLPACDEDNAGAAGECVRRDAGVDRPSDDGGDDTKRPDDDAGPRERDGGSGSVDAGRVDSGPVDGDDGGPRHDDAGPQPSDAGLGDDDAGADLGDAGAPDPPAPDAGPPPPPTFPETIRHLSFAVRTAGDTNAHTDSSYEVCLNATRCFPLDVRDVDDMRRGDFDVYHFRDVGLPRSEVDRVELRHVSGGDAWRPVCVETRFDGEPVQCRAGLDVWLGDGAGESPRFRVPGDVSNGCRTCYASRVTHGPLVGAVTHQTARVLVRSDATRPISLRVERAADASDVTTIGPVYPRPGSDFTHTFVVPDLQPRTAYVARVVVGQTVTDKVARFRTAPPPGATSSFRVAAGSCSNNHTVLGPHPIFDAIRERSPDVFLFLGDNHYGNTGDRFAHWWNYRDVLSNPPRARLVSSTSTLAIWDDHDYTGNNGTRHSVGKRAALNAFRDYSANPSYGTAAQPGVFFRVSHGDVDFFMLDVRYERDRPPPAGSPPAGSILGEAQHAWLEQQLLASTATFKVLVSGSLFSRSGGETWWEYASRARLFSFIRNQNIGGVVLMAGDIHRSALRWIDRQNDYDLPEIIASGLANVDPSSCNPGPAETTQVACYGNAQSFAELDIDTTRADPRIIVRLIGQDGAAHGQMTIRRSQLQ